MQREYRGGWRQRPGKGRLCLSLGILSLGLVGGQVAMSGATESRPAPVATEHPSPPATVSQERFLQQFISQSLGQKATAEREAPAATPTGAPQQAPRTATPVIAVERSTAMSTTSWSATVMTMVLSLAAILGCLLLVAYVIRRYLLSSASFGKRAAVLRVIARTHLTPKAVVALLEVPGKTLVIGVTGSTVVTLGEVVMPTENHEVASAAAPNISFAATLDQSTHELNGTDQGDETLLHVSERIQRKISRLKQL